MESSEGAVDPTRLAQARDEVRCLIAAAAGQVPPPGDPAPATNLAAVFDEGARDLGRSRWPVLRLVEGTLGDSDPAVVRAALRYLGARADRLSVRTLEGALARPETRVDAALALCDAGEIAYDALAPAIRDPSTRALVLSRLAARGGEGAARLVETSLRENGSSASKAESSAQRSARVLDCILALAGTGPDAVHSLLRLGSDGTLAPDEALDALSRTPGAAEVLADLVFSRPRGVDDGLVLRALSALQPRRALHLLERRCLELRDHRRAVLECIASYGGEEGLGTLLRLAVTGRIAEADLEEPILATLARDRSAGRSIVLEWTRAGRRVELQVFQEFLLAHPGPFCAPALVAFGGSELFPSSDRRWALLLAGETGLAADADLLIALFLRLKPSEKELRAACLVAIRELGGMEDVERALEALAPRNVRRVLALLAESDVKSRPITTVLRLARELEGAPATNAP